MSSQLEGSKSDPLPHTHHNPNHMYQLARQPTQPGHPLMPPSRSLLRSAKPNSPRPAHPAHPAPLQPPTCAAQQVPRAMLSRPATHLGRRRTPIPPSHPRVPPSRSLQCSNKAHSPHPAHPAHNPPPPPPHPSHPLVPPSRSTRCCSEKRCSGDSGLGPWGSRAPPGSDSLSTSSNVLQIVQIWSGRGLHGCMWSIVFFFFLVT